MARWSGKKCPARDISWTPSNRQRRLARCQAQSSQTLEEFYALRNHPDPCKLYGLTSPHSLVLLKQNHWDTQEYGIEYPLHESYHLAQRRRPNGGINDGSFGTFSSIAGLANSRYRRLS